MAGRTLERHYRIYANGYRLSCFARKIGPLAVEFGEADLTAPMCDEARGYLPTQGAVTVGELNALFDNTASTGIHALLSARAAQSLMIPVGMRAAPVAGDPVFCALVEQLGYAYAEDGGAVMANVPFGRKPVTTVQTYCAPWGWLLHADGAETAVNTAAGIDDFGAVTALGGYMCYQVLAGNGTATIKVQDAATNSNGNFADLSGATSDSINCAVPQYGMVEIGHTATVRRYLRWQIVLGTATTVTFALAFVRAAY